MSVKSKKTDTGNKKLMFFKLRMGKHLQKDPTTGKQILYSIGDVIPSVVNLAAKHGTDKFQMLHPSDRLAKKHGGVEFKSLAQQSEKAVDDEQTYVDEGDDLENDKVDEDTVDDTDDEDEEDDADDTEDDGESDKSFREELESMTVADLKEFAKKNNINLGNAVKKDVIVQKILEG